MIEPDAEPNPTLVEAVERLHAGDTAAVARLLVRAQREFVELTTIYLGMAAMSARQSAAIRDAIAILRPRP